jgi:hypothetical protein
MHISGLDGYVDRSMALSKYVTATETWSSGGVSQRYELDATVMDNMKQQMSTLNRWFEEWTERGGNPFIHERLYRTRLPDCLQDAYMALTCYIHKTEANKQTALRIIEDRAQQLIAAVASHDDDDININNNGNAESCELDILSRVHALLVYQFIGLYDGDIRLRHVCEGHMPVLDAWCYRLVQYTAYPLGLTDGSYSSAAQSAGHFEHAAGLSLGDKCWMSWILAESIQRTWIIATAIHHFYAMSKDLQPMNCPHTAEMVFTSREGLWSARSAAKWEGIVSGVDVGFTRLAGCEKLFTDFHPSNVDEFAKMILRSRFGSDSVERWCMSDVTV